MPKKATKNKRGFTLTEVLIVVLIISVLAAIVYPMYTKVITKSRAVEAINLLEMVRNKQLQKFAKDKAYYTTVDGLGQITSSGEQSVDGTVLKVKDYTLSLNPEKSCITASYVKNDKTIFSFSSSYERSGLGCTGDICSSLGNVIGTAQDVCGCAKVCPGGQTLDPNTCECGCLLGCNQDGKCFEPYGGGESRPCAGGCGTETSTASCNGSVWTGSCAAPYLKHPISEACSGGGTRTRSCTPDCSGGTCGAWGACTGGKTACPSSCPAGQKRTAVVNQEDGACCVAKTSCPSSCPAGQKRDTSISYTEDGSCCVAQSACPATCEAGKKRNPAVNYVEQGECCIPKTACPATCASGEERDTTISYTEDGSCCKAMAACPATCPDGKKRDTSVLYENAGECCIPKTACPELCAVGVRNLTINYTEDGECCKGECTPGIIQRVADPSCTSGKCLKTFCRTCNSMGEWGAATQCLTPDDKDPELISPVRSSLCCPREYRYTDDERPRHGSLYDSRTGSFDFNAQYCSDGRYYIAFYSCHNLDSCDNQIPPQNGGPSACGTIQLWECPSGYSFSSTGSCLKGSSGKKYSATVGLRNFDR